MDEQSYLEKKEITVSLADLFAVLKKRWLPVLLAGVLVGALALLLSLLRYVPQYTAKTDVYIINEEYQEMEGLPSNDINTYNLALNVIADCKEILEGRETMRALGERLSLTKEELDAVEINITENVKAKSRILNVSVTSLDPELSYRLSETLVVVAREKINEFCSHDVKIVNPPMRPDTPSNARVGTAVPIAALLAMVFVYAVALLQHLLDDRIRTGEDVTARLDMSLLGELPDENEVNGAVYGHYGKKYGKYFTLAEKGGTSCEADGQD